MSSPARPRRSNGSQLPLDPSLSLLLFLLVGAYLALWAYCAVLLYDAITEPSRRYVGLLFVFLSVLALLRPGYLIRRRKT